MYSPWICYLETINTVLILKLYHRTSEVYCTIVMRKQYCGYLTNSLKHIQYHALAGLCFLGACNPQHPFDIENAPKPLKLAEGKKLYESKCSRCHDIGMSGAPKLGDKKDWGDRIVDGEDVMLRKAIAGIEGKNGGMPPKGGNYSLTDKEVKMVILYMISKIDTTAENTMIESPGLKR